MTIEQTLVIIKPDALQRGIIGHALDRLSQAGLRIIGAKVVKVSDELAREHYRHLSGKPFFEQLIKYIRGQLHGEENSGVLALVYQGENAVARVREIAGATNPEEADPRSLRGAYGKITSRGGMENIIHGSSDVGEAEREIKLWFAPDEIIASTYPVKRVTDEGTTRTWA